MDYNISISRKEEKLIKNNKSIPFGIQPTDHMFISEYKIGGWNNARIVPFTDLNLSPFTLSLHYGQTVFEGMKAFVMEDGRINIFRPRKHYDRFLHSLQRMCMPDVPESLFMEALHQLVQLDSDWIPKEKDGSLYLRPFMIATEKRIGVKVSDEYLFMIVATPAFQYYANPLKVKVETHYVRAANGGTGFAKCGGNYGASFYPTQMAIREGFDQVIWTDSHEHKFIEESGTMNMMFFIDETLITPPLSGTILDGVTRDSLLAIAKETGMTVVEKKISCSELREAFDSGKRIEAFGTGTAAVIAPIASLTFGENAYSCYIGEDAKMYQLKQALYDIRKGLVADIHHWNYII